jgi:hypothetical protein
MTDLQLIALIEAAIAQYRAEAEPAAPPPPQFVVVQPGDDLAAAFATGLPVHLVAGQTYAGITLPSNAVLVGNGASVVGVGKPALYVAPGTVNVAVSDLVCTSDVPGAVVQLGDNTTAQTTAAAVPKGIVLTRVKVPTHRGKRAFELNAEVTLQDCEAYDVFTTTGTDSSVIGILNTTGNITVRGGRYEGGSEVVLFGGDVIKLTDNPFIQNVTFEDVTFSRPLSWQTDGVSRVIKNIFEIKNGRGVIVRNCVLENCWKDGQDGYAFMLTPTRGGAVTDVLIEGCTVRNVGGGINMTAVDISGISTVRTTGIVVRNSTFQISKALYGGTGRFILTTGGTGTIDVDGVTVSMDGTSFVYAASGMCERIAVCNSTFNAGIYGLNIAGGANLSNWAAGCADVTVTGNTITGAASALKTNLTAIGKAPVNSYV